MSISAPKPTSFTLEGKTYQYYSLEALKPHYDIDRLPFSLKIILENLLRNADKGLVPAQDIETLLKWDAKAEPSQEISFVPARVLLQDFTGVPCCVDLASMREAVKALGGDPKKVNPLVPVELVIDHSVMADYFGNQEALLKNTTLEFQRNKERYTFLRWNQQAFENFKVVPPNTGIVHQVNLEYLARVVCNENSLLFPDTLVGTDSHTTMINGLGVLGWGVGGIEAEASMLGQPMTMLLPQVVGFEIKGACLPGVTATDVVLTVTEMLRKAGVVDKFVEFFGSGLAALPLADRATIANMAPEYGATCGIFPIDAETLKFLTLSGRTPAQLKLIEHYSKLQGLFRQERVAEYSSIITLDLATVEPCLAGPKRPQDRVRLKDAKQVYQAALTESKASTTPVPVTTDHGPFTLQSGAVVIAAITSCTNTSNPAVMLAAGLVAQKANALGLKAKPWVKTSLAPGSQVVTDYLAKAQLLAPLEQLGFNLVGYGCTTCIGNSGPLAPQISSAINDQNLAVCAVLSGNRNFEGRIHPDVRFAYLASPPLVVMYALAGTMDIDINTAVIGEGTKGPVYFKDLWPTDTEVQHLFAQITPDLYQNRYKDVFAGDALWQGLDIKPTNLFAWDNHSTYVQYPPYFDGLTMTPAAVENIHQARVLAYLGDSVTTDHISPAGNIGLKTPAGQYLKEHGVEQVDFNSYGSRRGNHQVMIRGTFANIRLRNLVAPGTEGGVTIHFPTNETVSIFEASGRYAASQTPLIILAGKEYGTGSSRDWAAKGTRLLGVRAVIAQSFERIHRSNLLGMGVLPLEFMQGENTASLGLTGLESFDLDLTGLKIKGHLTVTATHPEGKTTTFKVLVRIHTPQELTYFQHGGILPYMVRELVKK